MRHHITVLVVGALCLLFNSAARSLPEVAVTTLERPWVHEDEFELDALLHATPDQTVVLDLERSERGKRIGAIRKNSLRFVVEQERAFSFCIPEDDRHLVRVRMKKERGGTVLNYRRGHRCEPVVLEPGRYKLDIYHDGRGVPAGGKTAFVHQPQALGAADDIVPVTVPGFDFMAFRGANGKIVTNATGGQAQQLGTVATDVGTSEVWRITATTNTKFTLTNGNGQRPKLCRDKGGQIFTGTADAACPQQFDTAELSTFRSTTVGPFQFNLAAIYVDGQTWIGGPVHANTENLLFWNSNSETFTADYQGYDCTTPCDDTTLPLAQGQVALYAQCNFQGPAMVFAADKADLSIYDGAFAAGLGIGNNATRSIRVGSDVVARLYPEANHGGTALTTAADIPCLDATELGNDTLSSFELIQESAVQYIISSNGCRNCILTGIDLSNEDFSGFDFTGAVFTNADLGGTDFTSAKLAGANFSSNGTRLEQTNFSGTTLTCASFVNTDVSVASSFAGSVFAEDFSCYLDLEGATIDFANFEAADWRFFNLTGSAMLNVPDTLSSLSAPLDLSGIILNGVQWLAGKTLDHVNLGCYARQPGQTTVCPTPSGTAVCSTLQQSVLTGASLRKACLSGADLESAFLSFSNLDGADMSQADLLALPGGNKAVTLEGAFMRNVNLTGADLTGVRAQNVNFYSASGGKADASGVTAPGADFSGAYLAFADFSGSGSLSNFQGTTWNGAMLLGANFSQADLGVNTSGGVNSGSNTSFDGAYMQGTIFENGAVLDDVDFTNTYWDALGAGGSLNLLIPKQNLEFTGYWKALALPECPQALMWSSGNPPPMGVTTIDNTCPNALPGPCDTVWDQPKIDISRALFQSAVPPDYPQDSNASAENQCSSSFSDPNPFDLCWTITSEPPPVQCVASE